MISTIDASIIGYDTYANNFFTYLWSLKISTMISYHCPEQSPTYDIRYLGTHPFDP